MDFIIEFFRGIDGWVYYIMLVVNTILIFAIIGYLAEKNQEQLVGADTYGKVPLSNGPVFDQSIKHNEASIPKVAATTGNISNTEAVVPENVSIPTLNNITTQNVSANNNPAPNVVNNNSNMFVQNVPSTGEQMNVKSPGTVPIQASDNSTIDQKVPGILVIESNGTTSPK